MRKVCTAFVWLLACGVSTADVGEALSGYLAAGLPDSARALLKTRVLGESLLLRYYAGRLAAHDGAAKGHFRALTRFGKTGLEHAAHYELAESAYADPRGLYVTARKTFQSLNADYPDSPYVPIALYRIGRTFQITAQAAGDRDQVDSARVMFEQVVRRFPDSAVSRHAEVALAELSLNAGSKDVTNLPTGPTWPGDTTLYSRLGLTTEGAERATGTFWVQVGVFSNRQAIDALVRRLRRSVGGIRLVEAGSLTRVQFGPYATREKAERSSRHIALVESLNCRVIAK